MRALLDSGSQASFITEHKALSLKLMIQKSHVLVNTLGATQVQSPKGLIVAEINGPICVNLHIIPRITGCMPSHHVDVSRMCYTPNVKSAVDEVPFAQSHGQFHSQLRGDDNYSLPN